MPAFAAMKAASDPTDLKCSLFSSEFVLNFTWYFLRSAAPILFYILSSVREIRSFWPVRCISTK